MKRFARMLFAGLGIVIAGSAISLAPHKAVTASMLQAVTVTNPSFAVTQSGPWNVGITGTPSVNIGTPTVNLGAGSTVGITGTPTVTIGGSSVALPTKDLSTFASQNVSLQNRVPSMTTLNLLELSSTGTFANCCYTVPAGQTLVVTSIDITPVTPATGTNHVTLMGVNAAAATAVFRSFEVSNASSTHLDYPTGIAIGSGESVLIVCGSLGPGSPSPSAGDVDVYLQGYLTSN